MKTNKTRQLLIAAALTALPIISLAASTPASITLPSGDRVSIIAGQQEYKKTGEKFYTQTIQIQIKNPKTHQYEKPISFEARPVFKDGKYSYDFFGPDGKALPKNHNIVAGGVKLSIGTDGGSDVGLLNVSMPTETNGIREDEQTYIDTQATGDGNPNIKASGGTRQSGTSMLGNQKTSQGIQTISEYDAAESGSDQSQLNSAEDNYQLKPSASEDGGF